MDNLKLIKLDPTKIYICLVKQGTIEPHELVLPDSPFSKNIPIIMVGELEDIKFVEVKGEEYGKK